MHQTAFETPDFQPCAAPAPEKTLILLRILMRTCRAKARIEVFQTCALLLNAPKQGAQDYADALLRVLSTALPAGPVIHSVTTPDRSFDERWLLSLFDAILRQDHASASFLLRSRLPVHYRRPVGWLASELLERLDPMPEQNSQV